MLSVRDCKTSWHNWFCRLLIHTERKFDQLVQRNARIDFIYVIVQHFYKKSGVTPLGIYFRSLSTIWWFIIPHDGSKYTCSLIKRLDIVGSFQSWAKLKHYGFGDWTPGSLLSLLISSAMCLTAALVAAWLEPLPQSGQSDPSSSSVPLKSL